MRQLVLGFGSEWEAANTVPLHPEVQEHLVVLMVNGNDESDGESEAILSPLDDPEDQHRCTPTLDTPLNKCSSLRAFAVDA